MAMKSKIKWAALGGVMLSIVSLMVHLLLAKSSSPDLLQYTLITAAFSEDFNYLNTPAPKGVGYRRLWGSVKILEALQPYANPRSSSYPVATTHNNGFIYAKVFGGFENIRTSICDLVTIARLLNATLVIPEIQESGSSRGISSKFKSFSYIYNEDHFIEALASDVIIVKNLPSELKEVRKQKQHSIFKPKKSASPSFYMEKVLPKLQESKVIGLIINDGGGLEAKLPPKLGEYQRLRCRVAFHALHFRPQIVALAHLMVQRLRASGQPYLVYHPGLKRDSLAYAGCAELFQDIHTELIQYRRAEMIKQGIVKEKQVDVDSHARKGNGSCPLMPEEVGLVLRAMGYPSRTRIYVAGSEIFGGPRIMIPLRAMYPNSADRTSLCTKQELASLVGPETPLYVDEDHEIQPPPTKSVEQMKSEWNKAGPRPRPLPPPPGRPFYKHETEGWYGWVGGEKEEEKEPKPSRIDIRENAHRLLWDALDYLVSLEANAFFPGFDDEFSRLVMGHRLYEMASARTYRPSRRFLAELFNSTSDHLYFAPRNWTLIVREHLNKSLSVEGVLRESYNSKSKSFLSHPIPECSCTIANKDKSKKFHVVSEGEDECPEWMVEKAKGEESNSRDEVESEEEEDELYTEREVESESNRGNMDVQSLEHDEEMDPDD